VCLLLGNPALSAPRKPGHINSSSNDRNRDRRSPIACYHEHIVTPRAGPSMSDHTKIEWTDATWNPVRGCTKITPGCTHCYAATFAERFRAVPRNCAIHSSGRPANASSSTR